MCRSLQCPPGPHRGPPGSRPLALALGAARLLLNTFKKREHASGPARQGPARQGVCVVCRNAVLSCASRPHSFGSGPLHHWRPHHKTRAHWRHTRPSAALSGLTLTHFLHVSALCRLSPLLFGGGGGTLNFAPYLPCLLKETGQKTRGHAIHTFKHTVCAPGVNTSQRKVGGEQRLGKGEQATRTLSPSIPSLRDARIRASARAKWKDGA